MCVKRAVWASRGDYKSRGQAGRLRNWAARPRRVDRSPPPSSSSHQSSSHSTRLRYYQDCLSDTWSTHEQTRSLSCRSLSLLRVARGCLFLWSDKRGLRCLSYGGIRRSRQNQVVTSLHFMNHHFDSFRASPSNFPTRPTSTSRWCPSLISPPASPRTSY